VAGPLLSLAVTAFAAAQYAIGRPVAPEAWLAIAPLLASLAQRRLGQARAVARVAQSALLREVPRSVAAARLASRYLSASAEAGRGTTVSCELPVLAGAAQPDAGPGG